jgi:hypothetical protein
LPRHRFDRDAAAALPGAIHDIGKEVEIAALELRTAADNPATVEELSARIEDIGYRIRMKWFALNEYMNAAMERIDIQEVRRDDAIAEVTRNLQSVNIADAFNQQGFFVYLLIGHHDKPIYIGQSTNILSRLGSHMSGNKRELTSKVQIIRCRNKKSMNLTESILIKQHQPMLNVALL